MFLTFLVQYMRSWGCAMAHFIPKLCLNQISFAASIILKKINFVMAFCVISRCLTVLLTTWIKYLASYKQHSCKCELLTHWGRVMHVCVSTLTIIGSDNGLSPGPGWVGLWGFLWWAPSAKGKDHHGVSSGWSSVWHRSNTGLSSTQYEQIPIILGVWPFWLTPFFFQSITFWRAYG